MGVSRGEGPHRGVAEAARYFLTGQRWMAVCAESVHGEFRCIPAFLLRADGARAQLVLPEGHASVEWSGPTRAALVADEFHAYDGIRGVIVRGSMTCDSARSTAEFDLGHVSGFSFAGRVSPQLAPDFSIDQLGDINHEKRT